MLSLNNLFGWYKLLVKFPGALGFANQSASMMTSTLNRMSVRMVYVEDGKMGEVNDGVNRLAL